MDNNVSYSDVTALGHRQADHQLVYGQAEPSLQYGLLWLPSKATDQDKAPLVILIHGGCWLNAYDIRHSFPLSTALAEAGYAVWSLEYRRSGDTGGGWPGSFDDVLQGAALARGFENYSIDLDRAVIIGHSAGGHLGLLAGSELNWTRAIIGLAAITDVVSYSRGSNSCQKATLDFLGGSYEENPAAYREASPANHPLHPRAVLLHGDTDSIVPPRQASLPGASTRMLEDAGHFDWIHPATRAYQVLLGTLEEVLRK